MTIHPGVILERETIVAEILNCHQGQDGSLLPILHDVQAALGYIPQDVLPQIAHSLNLSKAEVWGVVTFYHDFRQNPAPRHVVKICRGEACQALGANTLAQAAHAEMGLDWHQASEDNRVSLEPVFCLGLCACGPAAMIDDRLVGRLDPERLRTLLEGLS